MPNKDSKKFKLFYNKFIYIIVVIAPLINLPQLFKIWIYKNASGVSFISWVGFSLLSVAWLIYGIINKQKPIIYMNFALMIIQALIAIGALLYA